MGLVSFTRLMTVVAVFAAAACGDLEPLGPLDVAYTRAGKLAVFLDGEVRLFDPDLQVKSGSILTWSQMALQYPATNVYAISADGGRLALPAGPAVEIYDTDTLQRVATITVAVINYDYYGNTSPIRGIALSADGSLVAISAQTFLSETSSTISSRLAVWRVSDQSLVTEIAHPDERLPTQWFWGGGLAFSPDGNILYGVDEEWTKAAYLTAWRLPEGPVLWESAIPLSITPGEALQVGLLALSADGAWLATGDWKVDLWRASDGMRQDQFQMAKRVTNLNSVSFAPDGQSLLVTQFGTEVFGLDGTRIREYLPGGGIHGCAGATLSPDGTRVISTCFPRVQIWDFATGNLLRMSEVTAPIY